MRNRILASAVAGVALWAGAGLGAGLFGGGAAYGQLIAADPFAIGTSPGSGQYPVAQGNMGASNLQVAVNGFTAVASGATNSSWSVTNTTTQYTVRNDKTLPLPSSTMATWQSGGYVRWSGATATTLARSARRTLSAYTAAPTYYFSAVIARDSNWTGGTATTTNANGSIGAEHFAGFTNSTASSSVITEGFQWGFRVNDVNNTPRLFVRTPAGGSAVTDTLVSGADSTLNNVYLMTFKLETDVAGTQDRLTYWVAGTNVTENSYAPSAANLTSEAALSASLAGASNGRDYTGTIQGDFVTAGITDFTILNPRYSGSVYHDEIRMATSFESAVPYGQTVSTWNSTGGDNWVKNGLANNSVNLSGWTNRIPNSVGSTAVFGGAITGPATVTVNTPVVVRALSFDSAQPYTIGLSTVNAVDVPLILQTGEPGVAAAVTVSSGAHTINAPIRLLASATNVSIAPGTSLTVGRVAGATRTETVTLSGGGTLKLAGTYASGTLTIVQNAAPDPVKYNGTIDILSGGAIVRGTGELAQLREMVRTYLTAPAAMVTPSGITSSMITPLNFFAVAVFPNAVSPTIPYYASFKTISATADDTLVALTYLGDTNLDGKVNGVDLVALLEGLTTGKTGWQNGDLNYDGTVDATDLGLLNGALSANLAPYAVGTSLEPGTDTGGAVPEPSTAAAAGGALLLAARRRRR